MVVQSPIHTDYAFRLQAVLIDVTGESIDLRRPAWVIMRIRTKMRKISCDVMDVYQKKTNGYGTKKESRESAKVFRGELCV